MYALRNRRVAIFGVSLATAAVVLTGCSSNSTDSNSTAETASESVAESAPAVVEESAAAPTGAADLVPADIAEDGILSVGMEIAYPPFGYYDTDNITPVGFDVDLANRIGEILGLKVDIQNAKFDSIIPSLLSNRYELGVSAFSVSDERRKKVDFIEYFASGDSGLVLAGNPKALALDTTLCGQNIGVLKGSTQEAVTIPTLQQDCATAGLAEINVSSIVSSDQMPISLQSGRIDIALGDSGNAAFIASQSDGVFEVAAGPLLNSGPGGMIVKNDSALADAIAAALNETIADGSYTEIATKWGMSSGSVAEAVVSR